MANHKSSLKRIRQEAVSQEDFTTDIMARPRRETLFKNCATTDSCSNSNVSGTITKLLDKLPRLM